MRIRCFDILSFLPTGVNAAMHFLKQHFVSHNGCEILKCRFQCIFKVQSNAEKG